MTESQCLVVLCSCPDGERAAQLARALVDARLAACVNRISGVTSWFRWHDRLDEAGESLLLIKTTAERLEALTDRIRELHPYELPEIVAVPVLGGFESYLDWIRESVA